MRRKLPLFVMIGAAGVLVPVLVALAQSSSTTSAPARCSPATCTASNPSASSSTKGKIIDEMIAILKETKSEKTFVVTAMALGRMGPEAKLALPQLIRNAERLKLFEDLFDAETSKRDRVVAQKVGEAIMMLAESKDRSPAGYAYPTPQASYSNDPYGPPGAAPCPVMSAPVVPGTTSAPGYVPTPNAPEPMLDKNGGGYRGTPFTSAPEPTPLPAVKKVSPKGGKSRTPDAPSPRYAR